MLYVICGATMVVCVVLIVVQLGRTLPGTGHGSIFWQEAIAPLAFGIAWLTKGRTFLKDKESQRVIPTAGRNRWCFGKGSPRRDSLETV